MSRTAADLGFEYCPFCERLFENEAMLKQHSADVHTDDD